MKSFTPSGIWVTRSDATSGVVSGGGLKVRYVDEGANLRGTGGALRQALEESALAEQFLVLYGDSYLCVDVRIVWDAFVASGSAALMSVFLNDGEWERSNVVFSEGMVTRYEKGLTDAPERDALRRLRPFGLQAVNRRAMDAARCSGRPCGHLHSAERCRRPRWLRSTGSLLRNWLTRRPQRSRGMAAFVARANRHRRGSCLSKRNIGRQSPHGFSGKPRQPATPGAAQILAKQRF